MHSNHTDADNIGVIIAGFIALAFVYALLQFIGRLFQPKPKEEIQTDIVAESLRVVSTPMQLPGGRWGHYETKLVECAPPMAPNNLTVHDRNDPQHRANCAECRDGMKFRGSGVSYRTN